MRAPLAIDLYCGLGGWTDGFLAEGYDVIGFDVEQHVYGEHRYPAHLVLQDVLTIHGAQFKGADVIVASPPCQEYSYMAMPWSRAKQIAREYRDGTRDRVKLTALFDACFRIQREACEASGRFIPLVVENVCGAQKWVGPAKWHYGSYYLWGDVPALMPLALTRKNRGGSWFSDGNGSAIVRNDPRDEHLNRARKTTGHANKRDAYSHTRHLTNQSESDALKGGGDWFGAGADCSLQRRASSKSSARKAASAKIAKIPFVLAQHIAHVYRPAQASAA